MWNKLKSIDIRYTRQKQVLFLSFPIGERRVATRSYYCFTKTLKNASNLQRNSSSNDFQGCRSRGAGGPYKGLNSPKMFKNLNVSSSSGPQNEKWLLYRKQKSCLGCKLSFVFYTCLPHFTLGLTILVDIRKVRQVYKVISLKKCNLFFYEFEYFYQYIMTF